MKINKEVLKQSIQKAKEQIFNKSKEGLGLSIHRRFSNVSMDINKSKNFNKKIGEFSIIGVNNVHEKNNFKDFSKRDNLNLTINADKIYNRRVRYSKHNPSMKNDNNTNKNHIYSKISSLINTNVFQNINQTMRLNEPNYNKEFKNENCNFELRQEKVSRNNQIIKQKTLQNPSKKR